jgi:hypothetical protein
MSDKYRDDQADPFAARAEELSMQEIDDALYGSVELPEVGRRVAKPLLIDDIWPDATQPRKAVPLAARGQWDGSPGEVPSVLKFWHKVVEHLSGTTVDVMKLLMNHDSALEIGDSGPVLADFVELVNVAASILHDGLQNPITVMRSVPGYEIESGERRWLAYHLLRMYVQNDPHSRDFAKIPAFVVERLDVWRQAAENGARRPLNAIQMARQLSLLIMNMYEGDPDTQFDAYHDLVLPGECDRAFYAQVKNGNRWPVKRGMSQRILAVTGLKSRNQVSQYRSLLDIDDDIWVEADLENWTEGAIREFVQEQKRPVEPVHRLTTVNTQPEISSETVEFGEDEVREGFTDTPPPKYYRLPDEEDFEDSEYVSVPPSTKEQLASRGHDFPTPGLSPALDERREGPLESTEPVLVQFAPVAVILDHLLAVEKATGDAVTLLNAIRNLALLSPEGIRQMIVRSGSAVDLRVALDGYYALIEAAVDRNQRRVIEFFNHLEEVGYQMLDKYRDED